MKKIKFLFVLLATLVWLPAGAQSVPELPIDKDVRIGKLPNGLTYYIRHNALPENLASFYIAQKVGSVQEEESQRGLAHFLEHMCFNGTDNFPGDRLIKYCESIGVKFGRNLNAYTSTDETVYNIDDVPVTESNIDSCLLILHDWADGLTLDPKEIDKERGVIHEEWRMRSSASQRIFERNLPKIYPGSRYGLRFPIGLMSVIDNFKPEELRAYYEKWYRPDLQGIIVVGDIDVDLVEAKIKEIFSPIKAQENPAKYETYPVPDNNEPIYIVDKDKEQQMTQILMFFKHDPMPDQLKKTLNYVAVKYLISMSEQMLNARLQELAQKPDCPFALAQAGDGNFIMSKTKDAYSLVVIPKPGQETAAVQVAMQEVERATRFGFTATELVRAREEFLSAEEKTYDNRDKQRNDFFVPQYVRHFLENDPIPSIEDSYQTYKMLVPQMPVEAVNQVFQQFTCSVDTNFVLLAMFPEKEGVTIPTSDDMKKAVEAAKKAELTPYVDNVKNEPLVPNLPEPKALPEAKDADFGYKVWNLDNGARVFFKQTDIDDSQVLFSASSFGGKNKTSDADIANVKAFDFVVNSCGVGNFTQTELQKKLAGKQASVNVKLGELSEQLSGESTPKDLRTLFELIHLRFQPAIDDNDAYNNIMNLVKASLENAEKNPMKAFNDSIMATIYKNQPRKAQLNRADLDKVTYEGIKKVYAERFASAGDFDFFFTGAFNPDSLKAFVAQYIATLPGVKNREQAVDLHIDPAKGKVDNHFRRAMETPQAIILQIWHGKQPWTVNDAQVVSAFGEILTQRYLKSIREDAGIAYSVGARAELERDVNDEYQLTIQCPVKPASLDSALLLMRQGIEDIAAKGVTAEELDKVKKYAEKALADNQKKNGYWDDVITEKVVWNKDSRTGCEAAIQGVTSDKIRAFAKQVLLKQGNCITISMLPADFSEEGMSGK
ncbi:MAG: insulinase family protein [Bacteroidales bacterium]|nr:insulinase family protein [Bacteroidales bacterium]MDD6555323.1 insulinase family protein [Bacteroidales bacterium]